MHIAIQLTVSIAIDTAIHIYIYIYSCSNRGIYRHCHVYTAIHTAIDIDIWTAINLNIDFAVILKPRSNQHGGTNMGGPTWGVQHGGPQDAAYKDMGGYVCMYVCMSVCMQ